MASFVIFAEIPEWTWHYDPALDSLFVMGQTRVRMYFYFNRFFGSTVLSQFFDPEAPFEAFPLYLAHPVFPAPENVVPPPQPADPPAHDDDDDDDEEEEEDPSEQGSTSSSGGDQGNPAGMANGFLPD